MPDLPQVHHTYHSLQEAETWAQSLGVIADYDARLDLANLANELLWQLNQRSLPLPDEIRVDALLFRSLDGIGAQSPASANKTRMNINPLSPYWINPVRSAAKQRLLRFWSSETALHPLYHEAGHILVYKGNPDSFETLRDLTNAQKTIVAGEVSSRACLDAHEFVSEVFAGLMAGQTFSKDVMPWYRSRGGRKL